MLMVYSGQERQTTNTEHKKMMLKNERHDGMPHELFVENVCFDNGTTIELTFNRDENTLYIATVDMSAVPVRRQALVTSDAESVFRLSGALYVLGLSIIKNRARQMIERMVQRMNGDER